MSDAVSVCTTPTISTEFDVRESTLNMAIADSLPVSKDEELETNNNLKTETEKRSTISFNSDNTVTTASTISIACDRLISSEQTSEKIFLPSTEEDPRTRAVKYIIIIIIIIFIYSH